MWIFTTKGFVSIVQHKDMSGHFQVKSRVPDTLGYLFPDEEIKVIDWADYRFRMTLRKEDVFDALLREMRSILYTGFKDACNDEDYHYSLTQIWSIMYSFQGRMEIKAGQ